MLIKHDTWALIRYWFTDEETNAIRKAMDRYSVSVVGYRIYEKELELPLLTKLKTHLRHEGEAA
jgi:hypothetical protein